VRTGARCHVAFRIDMPAAIRRRVILKSPETRHSVPSNSRKGFQPPGCVPKIVFRGIIPTTSRPRQPGGLHRFPRASGTVRSPARDDRVGRAVFGVGVLRPEHMHPRHRSGSEISRHPVRCYVIQRGVETARLAEAEGTQVGTTHGRRGEVGRTGGCGLHKLDFRKSVSSQQGGSGGT
jgi:hypothetical protein